MTEDEYIKSRLDDQINWYDGKSVSNQKQFKRLRLAEIVLAAIISISSALGSNEFFSWSTLVACLGGTVTIIAGVLALYQYQENWIEYRTTCESLRKEKHLYLTKTAPYDGPDSFQALVTRVETLVSSENTNWSHFMATPRKGK